MLGVLVKQLVMLYPLYGDTAPVGDIALYLGTRDKHCMMKQCLFVSFSNLVMTQRLYVSKQTLGDVKASV